MFVAGPCFIFPIPRRPAPIRDRFARAVRWLRAFPEIALDVDRLLAPPGVPLGEPES